MDAKWQAYLQSCGAVYDTNRIMHFGNLPAELTAAMQSNIITDLSHRGIIQVSGVDAVKFLQGQLTCDVNNITQQHSCLGAHLNPKGRVLFTFRLFKRDDLYLLFLPRVILAPSLAQLKKYAVFYKCELSEADSQLLAIGISGPDAESIIQTIVSVYPRENNDVCYQNGVSVSRIAGLYPRFEIFADLPIMLQLWQQLQEHTTCAGADAWQLLNIHAGIPTIYPATIGHFTPHQINYPLVGGVSFSKGCYTGQEIVARMQYLGKLKSHMYRCHVATQQIPKPGYLIMAEHEQQTVEVGQTVIAKIDPNGGYQMLAVLKDEFAIDNVCFFTEDKTAKITMQDLPYQIA